MSKFIKPRYGYYKCTTTIVDNEVDEIVEDVVERLNFHDRANNELLKVKQMQYEQIIDLKEQLKNAIVPKFKRQEIVYSIEYGEISEIEELQVVAYLDNYIILCENRETSKLDWVHKDYLFATKEGAEQRLKEIKNG